MIIQKEYKFYAAHRNETLMDKCSNLHGHRYGLRCFFEVERDGDISTLFGAFDEKVEPWLKALYDHGMLINIHDPLYETLSITAVARAKTSSSNSSMVRRALRILPG